MLLACGPDSSEWSLLERLGMISPTAASYAADPAADGRLIDADLLGEVALVDAGAGRPDGLVDPSVNHVPPVIPSCVAGAMQVQHIRTRRHDNTHPARALSRPPCSAQLCMDSESK